VSLPYINPEKDSEDLAEIEITIKEK